MTLKRGKLGSYTILGLQHQVVCGLMVMVHLALKVAIGPKNSRLAGLQ